MITYYILIFIPPIIGLVFSLLKFLWLRKIHINGPEGKLENVEDGLNQVDKMKEVASYIAEGANVFLKKEYQYLSIFIVVFSILIASFIKVYVAISFIIGCLTSILCGYIGMRISVYANVRATNETWKSLEKGYQVTLNAGTIMGFSLVSLCLISLSSLIFIFQKAVTWDADITFSLDNIIAGFGLGASSIALFSRVGGGIYTKAADVGADLSGKNEYGIPEDDIRNPACIADNVGDNVGDVAGMGSDLFGSLAESLSAAFIIGSSSIGLLSTNSDIFNFLIYPLVFTSLSIIICIITIYIITLCIKIKEKSDVEKSLKYLLFLSTLLQSFVIIVLQWFVIPRTISDGIAKNIETYRFITPSLLGLWSGLIIGLITEFYTSYSFKPVREIADTQKISAATGIIYGLSLGYKSTFVPIICLSVTIGISYFVCGTYGIALTAVGMLSTLCIAVTIDVYGPVADNAGGIAQMAGLPLEVRERTDVLDAAGNTTAAIGKGFAIGSATLVAFALFGSYASKANISSVNILNPLVLIGLLLGSMLPYLFSSLTMKSVAIAANSVLNECLEQFPLILSEKQKPDYAKCVNISTEASLRQMIIPGLISILSPLIVGVLLGKHATAGLLIGIILSGVQLAFSSINSGGAWDNSKKYIESGALGVEHSKGSNAHKNSVIGDTVGDPLKDTSGPSLNILIKLSAITSVVFAKIINSKFTSDIGGPFWLKL